jgi:hypothetical protein
MPKQLPVIRFGLFNHNVHGHCFVINEIGYRFLRRLDHKLICHDEGTGTDGTNPDYGRHYVPYANMGELIHTCIFAGCRVEVKDA